MGKQDRGKQFKPRVNRLDLDRHFEASAENSRTELTYDDYIKSMSGEEKIIDISDETVWYVLGKNIKKALNASKSWVISAIKRTSNRTKNTGDPSLLVRFRTKKIMVGGGVSLGVVVLAVVLLTAFRNTVGNNNEGAGVVGSAVINNLDGKSISPRQEVLIASTTSDSQDLAEDPKTEFSLYDNRIQDYTITVSKQVIPEDNIGDPEGFLDTAAASFTASTSFITDKGKVYLANIGQEKDQSQVAFFVDKGLVVFLRAQDIRLSPEAWIEYINKL